MEYMLMPLKRYAEFNGRSRRMEFWVFRLFDYLGMVFFLIIMLAGLPWSEMDNGASGNAEPDIFFWIGLIGFILWYLAMLVPSVAVCVRRFHDQDKSGWMWLIYFIPYIGPLVIIVFMFIEGTRGPNQYGEDPKDPHTAGVFS